MTRLILIPILIACICLAACKKDNDKSQPSLVGKWLQIEHYAQGPSTCSCWVATTGPIGAFKVEFKTNGSFTMTPPMYYSAAYCPGTYAVEGDSLVWSGGLCSPSPTQVKQSFILESNDRLLIKYHQIPNYYYEMRFKRVLSF